MPCPHCAVPAAAEQHKRTALGYRTFRCLPCRRTLNERTGTPLNHLHAIPCGNRIRQQMIGSGRLPAVVVEQAAERIVAAHRPIPHRRRKLERAALLEALVRAGICESRLRDRLLLRISRAVRAARVGPSQRDRCGGRPGRRCSRGIWCRSSPI
jgi:hypothetical protein